MCCDDGQGHNGLSAERVENLPQGVMERGSIMKGRRKDGEQGGMDKRASGSISFGGETGVMGVPRRSSLDPAKPRVAAREVLQGLAKVNQATDVLHVRRLLAKGADLLGPNVSESQRRLFVINQGIELSLSALKLFSHDSPCVIHGCSVVTECVNLIGGSPRASKDLLVTAFHTLSTALSPSSDSTSFPALEMLTFLVHESPIGTGHMQSSDAAESDDGSDDPDDSLAYPRSDDRQSPTNRSDFAANNYKQSGQGAYSSQRKRRDNSNTTGGAPTHASSASTSCFGLFFPTERAPINGAAKGSKQNRNSGKSNHLPQRIGDALQEAGLTERLCLVLNKGSNSAAVAEYALNLLCHCIAVLPKLHAPHRSSVSGKHANSIDSRRANSATHCSSTDPGVSAEQVPAEASVKRGDTRAVSEERDTVQLVSESVDTAIASMKRFPRSLAVQERAVAVLGAVARRPERECRELVDTTTVLEQLSSVVVRLPQDCRELQRCLSRIMRAMAFTDVNSSGNTKLHLAAAADLKCCAARLLKRNANVDAVNNDGLTPAEVAARWHSRGSLGVLHRAGARS